MGNIIIVGVVIRKENSMLMVQEAKKICYGQWNFPAGHLDLNENIFDAAKREAKEETGYDVELTGLVSIQNYSRNDDQLIRITFNANIVSGEIKYDTDEILDVKWIPIQTLENMNESEIRGKTMIFDILNDVKDNKNYPLEVIKTLLV